MHFYVLTLLICEALFLFRKERKKGGLWKVILLSLALIGAAYGYTYIKPENVQLELVVSLLGYLLFDSLTILIILFCFRVRPLYAVNVAMLAFIIQNLGASIAGFFIYSGLIDGKYVYYLITSCIDLVVFTACFVFLSKPLSNNESLLTLKSFFILFPMLLLGTFGKRIADLFPEQEISLYVNDIYQILTGLLFILLMTGVLNNNNLHAQLQLSENMLLYEKEKYNNWVKTMDAVNVKYHDLKKIVTCLESENELKKKTLEELKEDIEAYDSIIQTENETMNMVLFEKEILCRQKGITLDALVSMKDFDFMSKEDIYTLFSNILDNAIENVDKVTDVARRHISLKIERKGAFIVVFERNFSINDYNIVNGRFQTTKKDTNLHGFGIKSIQATSEKYHGTCTIKTKDDTFTLTIVFPIQ